MTCKIFLCWYVISYCDLTSDPLTLNIYSTLGVIYLNTVQNFSEIMVSPSFTSKSDDHFLVIILQDDYLFYSSCIHYHYRNHSHPLSRVCIPEPVFSFPGIGNAQTSFPGVREWCKVWRYRHWLRQLSQAAVSTSCWKCDDINPM